MHLGRFHAVIYDLVNHFDNADLVNKLNHAVAQLAAYTSSRSEQHITTFREAIETVNTASEITNPDLLQPYAQQVIDEIGIRSAVGQTFRDSLASILNTDNFDTQGLADRLSEKVIDIKNKIASVKAISSAFLQLNVEYQKVQESQAEVGFMLPREAVGDSLKELSSEFTKLGNLAKAINEISGAEDYDPQVVTISSSWWQVFLDLDPAQIALWVMAIERIVALYKSGLEIKKIQKDLQKQEVSPEITTRLGEEIDKKMSAGINAIAVDIRTKHSKVEDEARANELEIAIRQGLTHLAMRISQGAQVEINVALQEDNIEEDPANPGLPEPVAQQIADNRARLQELRNLRSHAQLASSSTYQLSTGEVQLLIGETRDGGVQ